MITKYLTLFLLAGICHAQGIVDLQKINNYKYAIVPSKFAFQSSKDQHQLNTYTKMFMQKYGFNAFLDTDMLPTDAAKQNCDKIYVNVNESNSLFLRRLTVTLRDCRNELLFTSQTGQSKDKDIKKAYAEALRDAFNSLDVLKYRYNGNTEEKMVPQKESVVMIEDFENSNAPVNNAAVLRKSGETTPPATVKATAGDGAASGIDVLIKLKLLAVKSPNGYELIHTNDTDSGQNMFSLLRTSVKNLYIAKQEDFRNGILVNKNGQWYFEFYEKDQFFSAPLQVPGLKAE